MTAEMKSRMRVTAPLRTGSSHHTIHHVNVTAGSRSETKSDSHRCWICKTQAHWTDECQKFLALNPEERIKIAQENHTCFSCLKRAGRDHKLITCNPKETMHRDIERYTVQTVPPSSLAQEECNQRQRKHLVYD